MRDYAHHHPVVVVIILFCAWGSLSLIARMWLVHRKEPLLKKLGWSCVLAVPLFGWIFYGAFFKTIESNNFEPSVGAWGDGT